MKQIYRLNKAINWSQKDNFFILNNGENNAIYITNQSAIELLNKINGVDDTFTIINQLSHETAVPFEKVKNDLNSVFAQFEQMGIIVHSDALGPNVKRKKKNAELFSHMLLELTWDCNLRCKHCYMEGGKTRPYTISKEKFSDIIRQFKKLGGAHLTLSGGETFLYEGWDELAALGHKLGLQLALMTNGTFLDESRLSVIKAYNMGVGLGLDGIRAETHDMNRGEGSFEATMKALDLLERNNHHHLITICFTPMGFNVYDLPGIYEMMKSRGFGHLYISMLEQRGRAKSFWNKVAMTQIQKEWLFEYLYQVSIESKNSMFIEVTHHVDIFNRLIFDIDTSSEDIPRYTIRVSSEGEIYLSAYLGAPEQCVGKIGESTLEEMINSEMATNIIEGWSNRVEKIPKCFACNYKSICKGGSGTLAYTKHNTFLETDEFCEARIHLFDLLANQKSGELIAL